MILGPNNKVAQRARDAHRNALLAAEKEKRKGTEAEFAPSEVPPAELMEGEEAPAAEIVAAAPTPAPVPVTPVVEAAPKS